LYKRNYVNNLQNGLEIYYYENNTISCINNYINNKLNGISYVFYKNSDSTSLYKNESDTRGEPGGFYKNLTNFLTPSVLNKTNDSENLNENLSTNEYKHNTLKSIINYVNNKKDKYIYEYYQDGSLKKLIIINNDNYKEFKYINNYLKYIKNYINNKLHDKQYIYYNNSNILHYCSNYKKNKLYGLQYIYNIDGSIKKVINYL
jgi:antitoxin component YwqK of YwqJK toxin-antitoxin module